MANNFCTFVGRIAKEPQSGQTQNGVNFSKFCVILDEEKEASGAWVQCQAWRDVAKKSMFLKTNDFVYVTSKYRTYSYKDRHGETAYGHNFLVDDVVKISMPAPPAHEQGFIPDDFPPTNNQQYLF